MDWLIADICERDSLIQVFGTPGAAKTFAALDMGLCIAAGIDYHGRKVRQGPVIYVTGEGQNGLARRAEAWSSHNGIDRESLPFYVSTLPAALDGHSECGDW
jgi:RecA-family ATPase